MVRNPKYSCEYQDAVRNEKYRDLPTSLTNFLQKPTSTDAFTTAKRIHEENLLQEHDNAVPTKPVGLEATSSTARHPSQVMEYLVKEIMPGKWYAIPNAATNTRNALRNERYRDLAKDPNSLLESTL